MTIETVGAWILAAAAVSGAACAQQASFMPPTPEELSMTSLPGYPGAAAVVLNREEMTKDDLHGVFHYERIKILTKEGEKYANVTLPFVSFAQSESQSNGNDKTLDGISGRTIHPDGTIIPFTGKPYLKVLEKDKDMKVQERVFTLPDVEVGSIIEYRYSTRIADNIVEAPEWLIQGDLYVKQAHYVWYPTSKDVDSGRGLVTTITWFPILPADVKIERRDIPHSSFSSQPIQVFELTIKDVPPEVKEAYMPPISSFSYRVLFNFTAEHTMADWWRNEGKDWSKGMDSFADPNSDLKKRTAEIIAGATTDDQKLRKIYAAVMALENTRYTRAHNDKEQKAEGGHPIKNAVDVLSQRRGSAVQLAALYVGMARAAGMKAYFMYVPDRSVEIFVPTWESFRQFDDVIAIVNVDGKETYFDPGCRYCAYGHLTWEHTLVQGLRQAGNGTEFGGTPSDDYKFNEVTRVANLTMDKAGQVTGTIDLTFMGADAVEWRHKALSGDDESLNHALRTELEEMVPSSLQVKVGTVDNLTDYEQPLKVSYDVTGTLGTHTGKRILLPSDIFLSGESAAFGDEKRQLPVYFHFPRYVQDAQRMNLPTTMSVEALPDTARFDLPKEEAYTLSIVGDAKGYTTRRNHVQGELLVMPKDYDSLRKFYALFQSKDQESVVLKAAPAVVGSGGN
jgi:hypothetical protein